MTRHLIIFTRMAQMGRVKRRLAGEIGALAALRFHRAMQQQLMQGIVKDKRWKSWIAITPDICTRNNFNVPDDVALLKQGRGDLGMRMAHCFRALPPGPAVLAGSDIPAMAAHHIARAFASLGRNDYVFGPARDGGYWLVGIKHPQRIGGPHGRNLFTGMRWSGPHVLRDSLAALGPHARIGFVETLSDVDSADDYHHWRLLCSSRRGMISTKLQGRNR